MTQSHTKTPSRHRLAGAILVGVLAVIAGCETVEALTSGLSKPSAAVKGVKLSDLALDAATLAFDVEVKNPYSVALPLVNLDYELGSGGTTFLTGAADVAGSIPAGKSKVLNVPARVEFTELLAALSGVRPGAVVPYDASLNLSVDAPGVGPLELPISKKGELPVPTVPKVELTGIEWDRLSLEEARAVLKLNVVNQNQFPLDLSGLDYELSLGGATVARTRIEEAVSFAGGGANELVIPLSFTPRDLGLGILNMLTGSATGYELSGAMDFDSPFGPVSLPFERSGQTPMRR